MEINMKIKKQKYCVCCGREEDVIMNELLQADIDKNGNKTWEGHKLSSTGKYFYDNGSLEYCNECGAKLDEEDIHTTNESRGEFWGAPCSETIVTGYTCHECGFEDKF